MPEALDDTDGRCVPHQIAAATKKTLKFEERDIDSLFDEIFEDLYPEGSVDNPYEIDGDRRDRAENVAGGRRDACYDQAVL